MHPYLSQVSAVSLLLFLVAAECKTHCGKQFVCICRFATGTEALQQCGCKNMGGNAKIHGSSSGNSIDGFLFPVIDNALMAVGQ